MRRIEAITAVRDGTTITNTARRFGVSRATLHRWLKAFDPNHPIASLRPQRRGPEAPRWGDDIVLQVMELIGDHPDWWGRRRVARALSERGVTLSEATVGRILVVARERIAVERQREARKQNADRRRRVRVTARRHERDTERRSLWRERLEPAFAPGLPAEERLRSIAQVLALKRYKIQVKDLTPELCAIADEYIENLGWRDTFSPAEKWLIDAHRWLPKLKDPELRSSEDRLRSSGPDVDHLRAAALNHLGKHFGPAALPPARISIPGGDQSEELG
jgi:transposase